MGDRTAFFYGTLVQYLLSSLPPGSSAFSTAPSPIIHASRTSPAHPPPNRQHQMAREILHRVLYGPSPSAAAHRRAAQLTITPALLPRYCRHKVRGLDYPGIAPAAAHSVRGTYVTGLTDGDVGRLDRFEGDEYTRQDVAVVLLADEAGDGAGKSKGKAGEERRTTTYVYTAARANLEDEEWDYDLFRREKLWRWTGSGAAREYQEVDEAGSDASGSGDPTGGRSGMLAQHEEDEKLGSAV